MCDVRRIKRSYARAQPISPPQRVQQGSRAETKEGNFPEREGLLIKFLKSDPVSGGLMLNPRNSEGFLNQPRLLLQVGRGTQVSTGLGEECFKVKVGRAEEATVRVRVRAGLCPQHDLPWDLVQ